MTATHDGHARMFLVYTLGFRHAGVSPERFRTWQAPIVPWSHAETDLSAPPDDRLRRRFAQLDRDPDDDDGSPPESPDPKSDIPAALESYREGPRDPALRTLPGDGHRAVAGHHRRRQRLELDSVVGVDQGQAGRRLRVVPPRRRPPGQRAHPPGPGHALWEGARRAAPAGKGGRVLRRGAARPGHRAGVRRTSAGLLTVFGEMAPTPDPRAPRSGPREAGANLGRARPESAAGSASADPRQTRVPESLTSSWPA